MKVHCLLLMSAAILAGCQTPAARAPVKGDSSVSEPEAASATTDATPTLPESQRTSQLDSYRLDGSSVDAFRLSMDRFRQIAPEIEYVKLRAAIQYLLIYDLSVRGNPPKLYQKLDGKTPREVIALRDMR